MTIEETKKAIQALDDGEDLLKYVSADSFAVGFALLRSNDLKALVESHDKLLEAAIEAKRVILMLQYGNPLKNIAGAVAEAAKQLESAIKEAEQ